MHRFCATYSGLQQWYKDKIIENVRAQLTTMLQPKTKVLKTAAPYKATPEDEADMRALVIPSTKHMRDHDQHLIVQDEVKRVARGVNALQDDEIDDEDEEDNEYGGDSNGEDGDDHSENPEDDPPPLPNLGLSFDGTATEIDDDDDPVVPPSRRRGPGENHRDSSLIEDSGSQDPSEPSQVQLL